MERLDLDKGWWVSVEPMLSRRSTLGVAVLYDELYAVGGFDGTNGLDTVEKYNPSKSHHLHHDAVGGGGVGFCSL